MKQTIFLALLLMTLSSCKDKNTENKSTDRLTEATTEAESPGFPEALTKVFDAHGGLELWESKRTLEFSVEHPDGYEITTTDLKDRYALVEMPGHTIGFDGQSVWMTHENDTDAGVSPQFYYDWMFYLYAMPFVLADDGILYAEAQPLVLEGKTYPGIQIAYERGVGDSPNDEYRLYYDPETHNMVWLAYTMTHFKREKSDTWHFIKYGAWQEVDGLLLPETMSWYHVENNLPTTVKESVTFTNISLSSDPMDLRMYMMPEGAEEIM